MEFTITKPDHFSASRLNSFISYRSQWFVNYILGKRGPGNPNMYRGTAVEDGLNFFVSHREKENWNCPDGTTTEEIELIEQSVKKAIATFSMKCAESDDNPQYMLPSIGDCTRKAINEMTRIWSPVIPICQHKTYTKLEGVETPILCFLDYLLPSRIDDLKISAKTPDRDKINGGYKLTQNYIIQGSIYKRAMNEIDVEFHYIIPLKSETKHVIVPLTDQDYEWGLAYATLAAQKLEEIYRILDKPFEFQDRNDLGQIFANMSFPNPDDFWNQKEKKHVAKVWSLPEKKAPPSPSMPSEESLAKTKTSNPFFQ